MVTKREKVIIEKAVDQLMADDGDFSRAIDSLLKLVGKRLAIRVFNESGELKPTTIDKLPKKESKFSINNKGN